MATYTQISDRHTAIDELDRAIVNLSARINASTYELLVLIREFDERAGWLKWNLESCSQWLHWRCDLSQCAAREKVRVAHALKELPEISIAFSEGRLSYSKVRPLTRVATPMNESELLAFALSTTATRVEERCQQLRNVLPGAVEAANRVHEGRSLRLWRDTTRGTLTLTVELPVETGEVVCQALDKAVEAAGEVGPEYEAESWGAQQADALVSVVRSYLSGESEASASSADAYQVVIHVDGAALEGGEGRSDLAIESVKRLSCDGSVVPMVDGVDGEPLNVGRKQRTVPAALKRALWSRDGGCSFPGCTHTRFVDPLRGRVRTTSVTGPTGARRASTTPCCSAVAITAWCTRGVTRSARTIRGGGISGAPTVGPFHAVATSPMTSSTMGKGIVGRRRW